MHDGPQLTAQPAEDSADTPPVEIEVKLRADPQSLAAVSASKLFAPAAGRPKSLRSVYFDTGAFDLRHAGIVLRVRSGAGGKHLMAMKFDVARGNALFHRHELEVEIESLAPDIARFGKRTARRLKRLMHGLPLEAKFETQVTRQVRNAVRRGSLIEAAFDEGAIVLPDGRKQELCELELELKSGSSADLFTLARRLAAEHPLRLDFTSKSEKGFALLRAEAPSPVKARVLDISERTLVHGVLSGTLSHFTGNWAALRDGDDAESVHQLRVALRRMKTALRMFGHVMPADGIAELKRDAGRIGSAFGRARDLDALLGLLSDSDLHAASGGILDPLLAETRRQRSEAFAQARQFLDSHEVTDFVLRAESFTAAIAARAITAGDMTAREMADKMLGWLHRRVVKRGRKLAKQTAEERHRLRIALKDLRYGIEFLNSLCAHRGRAERMARAASALQDILGAGNDVVTGSALLKSLAAPLGAKGAAAAGFAAGWFARDAAQGHAEVKAAWKSFRNCRPFWTD